MLMNNENLENLNLDKTCFSDELFKINKRIEVPKFSIKKDYFFTLILNGILFLVGMVSLWIMIYLLEFNVFFSKILSNALTFFLNFFSRIKFFNNVL